MVLALFAVKKTISGNASKKEKIIDLQFCVCFINSIDKSCIKPMYRKQ